MSRKTALTSVGAVLIVCLALVVMVRSTKGKETTTRVQGFPFVQIEDLSQRRLRVPRPPGRRERVGGGQVDDGGYHVCEFEPDDHVIPEGLKQSTGDAST